MKKNSVVFIDSSAWIAILDESNKNYSLARAYFEKILEQNARVVTNSYMVDETLSYLKSHFSSEFAQKFLAIIDDSVLSINLRVDWISRRVRRSALINFLKNSNPKMQVKHFYIYETIKRKRVDLVFSFDEALKYFSFPVMPQGNSLAD